MSDVLACERTYQMEIGGETRLVPVCWATPAPDPRGDWSCAFRIEWPHRPATFRKCYGIDSVQALVLAIQAVAAELYTAQPPVYWWEPDDVLGLPVPHDIADLEAARTKGHA